MRDITHPAQRLVDAMTRIYQHRMTTTSGGNLSILDEDGSIWITPARVDKGNLRIDDIVRVLPDGRHEGLHPPSSELPFHRTIYQKRPDLKAIIHAHPVALIAFSMCNTTPNTKLFAKAHEICGEVGFAPYALPGSALLGERIAEVFTQGHHCVLLENHGVAIGGSDLADAFRRFETLEFLAQTILKGKILGNIQYLNDSDLEIANQAAPTAPTFTPPQASSHERKIRHQLCSFIQRGYQQRLLTTNAGSFSARVDSQSFVINSRLVDRATITPNQLVLIQNGEIEANTTPSRAWLLHHLLYQQHPEIHSIVNATPIHTTAFAASSTFLDTRTVPESYLFLRDISVLPFSSVYENPQAIATTVHPNAPIALIQNDCALVLGTTILDAFDRLEVLETTAEALILSHAIGNVSPMSDEVISELTRAFLGS